MVASFNDRFEVTWKDLADAEAVWAIDRIHFAQPVAPLGEDFYSVVVGRAWETRTAFANGYLFMKDFAPPPTPPEVIELGARRIWDEQYLNRVRAICTDIRGRDYAAMSAEQIVAMLPEIFDKAGEAFRYPTVIASEFMRPALQFTVFCHETLGEEGPVLAATLLQGFENESVAAGAGLAELASLAGRHPELKEALKAGRIEHLESLPGGQEFETRFAKFMEDYGWRADEWCLVHRPTWAEQPRVALELVGRYLSDPDHSPDQAHERAVKLRETTARAIEARLPAEHRERFQSLLDAALAHVPFSEERALWQLIAIGSARVPLLTLGRKLTEAGVIDAPDDVFFLQLDELRGLATQPMPSQALIRHRKADLERYERLEPPQSIGAPMVITNRPPQSQIVHRFFFGTMAPPSDEKVIRGSAASQGVVTGRARIVRSLSESSRLQQGEVLVCKTTAPPWTPLFAIAAAVVTETGGILSHSAICAREYGIPCVVGTQVATSAIPDGATVTVDGNAGTVTIEG
ncbi:MAG TPA: PEP-utilizing enzyme [Dehalococcoidia bacterium]|nr:PEP-utilizing enzyme [Dehalococcoidia bacterium]